MIKKMFISAMAALAMFCMVSCKKGPGEGGNSSITGYVHVKKYNAFFTTLISEYDGIDEDVYIIYGDDATYGDRIKSGPDGRFEFRYLRKGKYTIYVYSDENKDSVASGKSAVMKSVEITANKQTVDAGTFVIKKD